MDPPSDDSSVMKQFLVLFLAFGIAIVSASLLFVPFDLLGYTGFALFVDLVMAIPFAACLWELWVQHRMVRMIGTAKASEPRLRYREPGAPGESCLLPRRRRTGERTRPQRIRRVERPIPLSGGMPRDEGLDPRPPSRELPLHPPMVGSHSTQKLRLSPLRVDAAEVVLFPLRPSVVPFVMPEVEVPPSVEVANPRTASDFHFIPLSRGISAESFDLPGGGG